MHLLCTWHQLSINWTSRRRLFDLASKGLCGFGPCPGRTLAEPTPGLGKLRTAIGRIRPPRSCGPFQRSLILSGREVLSHSHLTQELKQAPLERRLDAGTCLCPMTVAMPRGPSATATSLVAGPPPCRPLFSRPKTIAHGKYEGRCLARRSSATVVAGPMLHQ